MNYWQGKNIRLRAIEPQDADQFFDWGQDSQRARNLDFVWPPTSRFALREWAEKQARSKMEGDSFHWVIENLEAQPVGSIATHSCQPRNGTFSYGIDIAAGQRGRGYAQEAILLILRYYFEELRYQKVTVPVHSDNSASIRLHEKLGYQLEGRQRRMFYTAGRYVDVLWYGQTIEEWQARHFHLEDPKA